MTTTRSPRPHPPSRREIVTELQSLGLRLGDPDVGIASRRGGAGPSDHKAVVLDGTTIMVPVLTGHARFSPFRAAPPNADGTTILERDGVAVATIAFVAKPRFYNLQTFDGIAYWKLATLHGRDVLATTVLQSCVRYSVRATACQFCAIGQSLAEGRTIERKTPAQLAEVARAAQLLDGVRHVVLTTGTPDTTDRGARILCESAAAIKEATELAIQAQCEPPDDFEWFSRLRGAGVDALGMHLEAVEPEVRAAIMPGKARVAMDYYYAAFEAAVRVFGRGQVSTYLIAGLGDSAESLLAASRRLIALGVYPFVVPFVPISGTPLADHAARSAAFMRSVLEPLGAMLADARLFAVDVKAGCARCNACSSLAAVYGG